MRAIDRSSKGEEIAVALIRYAAINVVRSRRRTITAMIGVLLAVTFVSGTFIAIDSSTRATLDAFLTNLPSDIDFEARASANGTQLREARASKSMSDGRFVRNASSVARVDESIAMNVPETNVTARRTPIIAVIVRRRLRTTLITAYRIRATAISSPLPRSMARIG